MFKKVLEYAGEYRKTTYRAIAAMLFGVAMSVLPYLFVYRIINPLLSHEEISLIKASLLISAIAACMILHSIFYVKGLSLSHESAYHTLKNLRISLQGKLEKQPLGSIQEKGVGSLKKLFIDDIE